MTNIPLYDAMLCWDHETGRALIVHHPDRRGLSDDYGGTSGACFTKWRKQTDQWRRLQMLVDAWHAVAFYAIPAMAMHEALMVVPEYRHMLASDCVPQWVRDEREGEQ